MGQHAGGTGNSTIDFFKIRHAVRHDDITDALTGQGEGFAVGIADQCVGVVFRNIGYRIPFKRDFPIGFIGDDKDGMIVFFFLGLQDFRQFLNRCFRIYRTAGIVGAVDNNGLSMISHQFFKGCKVNLPVLRLSRHDYQFATNGFYKSPIFREERGKGDVFVFRLGQGLETNGNGCGCASRHKQIFLRNIHAKAAVDAVSQRLAHLRIARCHRIAMNGRRLHIGQNIHGRVFDKVRRRYIGIAQTKIIDIFLAYFSSPLSAKFKNGPNRRFFRAQFIHFVINHRDYLTYETKYVHLDETLFTY